MKTEFTITLPQSTSRLGRWLEGNAVGLEISCALGKFSVVATKKKTLSYDDKAHRYEIYEYSAHDENLEQALEDVLRLAGYFGPV